MGGRRRECVSRCRCVRGRRCVCRRAGRRRGVGRCRRMSWCRRGRTRRGRCVCRRGSGRWRGCPGRRRGVGRCRRMSWCRRWGTRRGWCVRQGGSGRWRRRAGRRRCVSGCRCVRSRRRRSSSACSAQVHLMQVMVVGPGQDGIGCRRHTIHVEGHDLSCPHPGDRRADRGILPVDVHRTVVAWIADHETPHHVPSGAARLHHGAHRSVLAVHGDFPVDNGEEGRILHWRTDALCHRGAGWRPVSSLQPRPGCHDHRQAPDQDEQPLSHRAPSPTLA